jgi:hypothetical protein
LEVQHLKLKKPYKSTSTLIQFLILFMLEIYPDKELTVQRISELIGCNADIVANEATFLLCLPQFNPKKTKTAGLLTTNAEEGKDIDPQHIVKVNPDFTFNALILTTIPTKARVINIF